MSKATVWKLTLREMINFQESIHQVISIFIVLGIPFVVEMLEVNIKGITEVSYVFAAISFLLVAPKSLLPAILCFIGSGFLLVLSVFGFTEKGLFLILTGCSILNIVFFYTLGSIKSKKFIG